MRRVAESSEARVLLLVALVLCAGAIREPRLLQASSINSILLWIPLLAIPAIGQLFVLTSRNIDVSAGSMLAICAFVTGLALRAQPQLSLWLAFGLALVLGTLLGVVNGTLVARARIPAIIVTLGTLTAYRGLTFLIARGGQIYSNDVPGAVKAWSLEGPVRWKDVTIPWLAVVAGAVALIAWGVLRHTVLGREVVATGSNPEAAKLHGIRTERATLVAFGISGGLAGLGGLMYLSRFGFVNPASAGVGLELTVIASAVLGGADVRGGSGSVLGVLLGASLLSILNVALAVAGVAADWQSLTYGAVLLIALTLGAFWKRSK